MAERGALVALDDYSILDRIAAGEYAAHIAPELGVSKQALQKRLSANKDYKAARKTAHQLRIDSAVAEIESVKVPPVPIYPGDAATDDELADYKRAIASWEMERQTQLVDLARARERFRAICWRAEREFPEEWGQKQEVHHTFSISDELRQIAERRQAEALQVVDGEVVHTQQTSRITSGADEG